MMNIYEQQIYRWNHLNCDFYSDTSQTNKQNREESPKRWSMLWLENGGWTPAGDGLKGSGVSVCVSRGRRVGVGERNIFWGRLVGWKWRAALGIHLERSLDSLSFLEMAVLSGSPGLSHVELGCVTHCFRSREIQSCSGSCPLVCFCVPSLSDVYVS